MTLPLRPKQVRRKQPLNRQFVIDRRLQNYAPIPEAGCWIWLGTWTLLGYGHVKSKGKQVAIAHRYFYTHLVGPIPAGMCVCHKCDTPACVNPEHLFIGTVKENMEDKWRKGRGRTWGKPAKRKTPYANGELP